MKNFLQIASGINVNQLALELQQNPDLWNKNPARLAPGSPHEFSDDIWVRYNDETPYVAAGSYEGFNDEHDPVWYPAYYALPSLRPLIHDLARRVESERIGGVFLWRVRPGNAILPHIDSGWHVDYYDKFNITIQSSPGCEFRFPEAGEAIQDRPGDVYRFNNKVLHSVVNNSSDDYIVMVVCLRVHDYSRRFKEPQA